MMKAEREQQGLSIEEVAELAGLPAEQIADFEGFRTVNPPLTLFTRYARALGKRFAFGIVEAGEQAKPSPVV